MHENRNARQEAFAHPDENQPGDRIPRQPVSGCSAVVSHAVGQLKRSHHAAGRFGFDCDHSGAVPFVGECVQLSNLGGQILLGTQYEMLAFAAQMEVQRSLKYAESLGKCEVIVQRRAGAPSSTNCERMDGCASTSSMAAAEANRRSTGKFGLSRAKEAARYQSVWTSTQMLA